MVEPAMFSSASVEWGTPQFLYDWLNRQYQFKLDPCATDKNHKCDQYFTIADDGINKNWSDYADAVFMNPPYGNSESVCKRNCTKKKCLKRGYHNLEYTPGIGDWVEKAHTESDKGIDVVCLIPARTDTSGWWHRHCMKADRIDFVVGRLSFGSSVNNVLSPATFPSAIVYFLGKTNQITHPEKPAIYSLYINRKTKEITVV